MAAVAETTKAALEAWAADPVLFAQEVLGLTVWSRQREILSAPTRRKRVAVRSGHKAGKSVSIDAPALWFALFVPDAQVILTSSGGRQVKDILWTELTKLRRRARVPIGGDMHELPSSGLVFKDGRRILGFSTDEGERMAGFSGERLVFLADEASGIPDHIFQPMRGNLAGGGWLILFGNPTQNSGQFYRAFHEESDTFETIHVSSEETPNITGAEPPIGGLARPDWLAEYRKKCGPDYDRNAEYKVRVKGEFAGEGLNNPVTLDEVTAAMARWSSTEGEGPLEVALDVARYGDDTSVAAPGRGKKVFQLERLPKGDGPETARFCVDRCKKHKPAGQQKIRVKVDEIGVGASAYDALKRMPDVEAVPINVARASDEPDDFPNLRSQIFFGLGAFCRDGGALPPDPGLKAAILAHTYAFDERGRRKVVSKDVVKKKLERSPDDADACAIFAYRARSGIRWHAQAGDRPQGSRRDYSDFAG